MRVVTGDPQSISVFQELFGGKVNIHNHSRALVKLYGWTANGKRAMDVLEAMVPYMRAKREQAQLVLDSDCNFAFDMSVRPWANISEEEERRR